MSGESGPGDAGGSSRTPGGGRLTRRRVGQGSGSPGNFGPCAGLGLFGGGSSVTVGISDGETRGPVGVVRRGGCELVKVDGRVGSDLGASPRVRGCGGTINGSHGCFTNIMSDEILI